MALRLKWRARCIFKKSRLNERHTRGCKLALRHIYFNKILETLLAPRFHNKRLISVGRHVPRYVASQDRDSVNNLSSKTVLHHVCRVRSMNNFQDCWTHYADGLVRECFPRSKSRRARFCCWRGELLSRRKMTAKVGQLLPVDYDACDKRVHFRPRGCARYTVKNFSPLPSVVYTGAY